MLELLIGLAVGAFSGAGFILYWGRTTIEKYRKRWQTASQLLEDSIKIHEDSCRAIHAHYNKEQISANDYNKLLDARTKLDREVKKNAIKHQTRKEKMITRSIHRFGATFHG